MPPTVDRYATDSWPTYHRQLTDIPPTYDRYSVEVRLRNIDRYSADSLSLSRPTGGRISTDTRPPVGRQSTDCRPTLGRPSTDYRSTIDRLSIDYRPLYRSTVDRYSGRHSGRHYVAIRDFTQRRREGLTTAFATERNWDDDLVLSTVKLR